MTHTYIYVYMTILLLYFLTGFRISLAQEACHNNNDYIEFHLESNSLEFSCYHLYRIEMIDMLCHSWPSIYTKPGWNVDQFRV